MLVLSVPPFIVVPLLHPLRPPGLSIAVPHRVHRHGADGIKVNPHKQVRLGPKVVAALLGIVQTVGNIEDVGEREAVNFGSVLLKTLRLQKLRHKAAHKDSKSTAGGVKNKHPPSPRKSCNAASRKGFGLHDQATRAKAKTQSYIQIKSLISES